MVPDPKPTVFDALNLPIAVQRSVVGRLVLVFPWRSLQTSARSVGISLVIICDDLWLNKLQKRANSEAYFFDFFLGDIPNEGEIIIMLVIIVLFTIKYK